MFKNRSQAGELLAQKLTKLSEGDLVILGIPRGGIPVAKIISTRLNAPLSLIVTKKISAPNQPELAVGAMGTGNSMVLDQDLIQKLSIGKKELIEQIKKAKEKVDKYKSKFPPTAVLKAKTVVLVDDGIATGSTLKAAVLVVKKKRPSKIIIAVPVASKDSIKEFEELVDEIVVLAKPDDFRAVGEFYQEFPQVTDQEVLQLLQA